jgi:hypothetical protein
MSFISLLMRCLWQYPIQMVSFMAPLANIRQGMDILQLTGQNLGQVFNFRSGHLHATTFLVLSVKLPNLQLKTRPKQLLGSLPLVIALPGQG